MHADVPFHTVMGVKIQNWHVFHSRGFGNSDAGTQEMPGKGRSVTVNPREMRIWKGTLPGILLTQHPRVHTHTHT